MHEGPSSPVRHSARQDAADPDPGFMGHTLDAQWSGLRVTTTPADRAVAEEGVRTAYHAAGLPHPRIAWHAGPVSLAMSWLAAPSAIGENVVAHVISAPFRKAVQHLDLHPDRRVMFLRDRFALGHSCVTSAAMHAAVVEDVVAGRPPLRVWLKRLGTSFASRRWVSSFAASSSSQHRLSEVGFAACLLERLNPRSSTALQGLRLIAENAGWMLPHVHVCWLSDRPVELSFEGSGRLHSSSGPALQYGDGWSAYRWKGTRVPRWVIDDPRRITLGGIDAEAAPAVRRAMIDIFTVRRFVSEGGADCALSDERGTLWLRKWTYRGAVIDVWAAIESTTPGGARTFQCVPTHLRNPAEALAWFAALPRQNDEESAQG